MLWITKTFFAKWTTKCPMQQWTKETHLAKWTTPVLRLFSRNFRLSLCCFPWEFKWLYNHLTIFLLFELFCEHVIVKVFAAAVGGDLISVVHQVLRVIPANAVLLPPLQRKLHNDDMIACHCARSTRDLCVFKCFNQRQPHLGHQKIQQPRIYSTWVPASASLVIPLLGLVSPPSPWL